MKHESHSHLPVYDFKASRVPEEQILFLMEQARRVYPYTPYGDRVYLVGGALRDLYLGGIVNDLDIYIHADHYTRLPSTWRPLGEYTGEITEKPHYAISKYKVIHFEPSASKPGWRPVDLIVYNGTLKEYIDTFDFGINQIWWDFEGPVDTFLMETRLTGPGQPLYVNNRLNASFDRAEGLCGKYAHLGFKHDVLQLPTTKYIRPSYWISSRGTLGKILSGTTSSVLYSDGDLCEYTR